jgi:hypothetical protein
MNPLVPTPDTLPAAWPLMQGLLLLVFPLHLLAMNGLLGTAAVVLIIRRRGGALDRTLAPALTATLPVLMALTVNLGVASLLFSQTLHGQFFYPSAILMGRYWLAIIPLLITAYAGLYLLDADLPPLRPRTTLLASMILALLLTVPFIFTNQQTSMLDPGHWQGYFANDGGTLLHLKDPTLWPRYLHFVVAALAVGGLFTALIGRRMASRHPGPAGYAETFGLRLFSRMTLLQFGVGMVFLWQLPQPVRHFILGGNPVAGMLLVAATGTALALLSCAAQRLTVLCGVLLTVQIFVMSGLREMVRHASLAGQLRPAEIPMIPQTGPLLLFGTVLLVGMATLGWLIKQAVGAPAVTEKREEVSEDNRAMRL